MADKIKLTKNDVSVIFNIGINAAAYYFGSFDMDDYVRSLRILRKIINNDDFIEKIINSTHERFVRIQR